MCIVCRGTMNLKSCSRCKLVTYCGSECQNKHFPKHTDICKAISRIMETEKLSHIFEKSRNVTPDQWKADRFQIWQEIETSLNRGLLLEEQQIILYPRSCYVCHDTRNEILQNCPGCPFATFCKIHPSSHSHDEECKTVKELVDLEHMAKWLCNKKNEPEMLEPIIDNFQRPQYNPLKQPTTMKEFLNLFINPELQVPEKQKIYSSRFLNHPLTFFNGLQKLNYTSKSEMIVHIGGQNSSCELSKPWETILHLIPGLKILKIMLFNYSGQKDLSDAKLCSKCSSQEKKIVLEAVVISYEEFMKLNRYQKPDFFLYLNLAPAIDLSNNYDMVWEGWEKCLNIWCELSCPLILTTNLEEKSKKLRLLFKNCLIPFEVCFDGKNKFVQLDQPDDYEDNNSFKPNEFLMIYKPRETGIDKEAKARKSI